MFCPRCYRTYDDVSPRCPADGAALLDVSPLEILRSRPTEQRGAIIGDRYAIQGFVGSGGMARVYLAEDTATQTAVALKILDVERAADAFAVQRFLREVEIAARIRHPNVVQILDAGERADGVPFIVLEFLFGESLGDLLRRDGAVEPAFALPLLRKAAAGLAVAHRAGIIHRDVKPDNLFLMGERGNPYELKVVDFGMAKLLEHEITSAGVTLGTIEYIAPEQAITDTVDARADVYGLGAVMFRMLCGRLPFDAPETALRIAQHLFTPPPPPRSLRPDLDPRLEAVVLKALRKDPVNRYATMDELQEDLERVHGEREGALRAWEPLRAPADVYIPRNQFATRAARALKARLDRAASPPSRR